MKEVCSKLSLDEDIKRRVALLKDKINATKITTPTKGAQILEMTLLDQHAKIVQNILKDGKTARTSNWWDCVPLFKSYFSVPSQFTHMQQDGGGWRKPKRKVRKPASFTVKALASRKEIVKCLIHKLKKTDNETEKGPIPGPSGTK